MSIFPAGLSQALISPFGSRRGFLLATPDADLLRRCVRLTSLEDHASHLSEELRLGPGRDGHILEQLRSFAHDGLLLERSALLRQTLEQEPEPEVGELDRTRPGLEQEVMETEAEGGPLQAAAPITSAGMITRDRVHIARRGLESYLANCREHDRKVTWTLLDDSPEQSTWTKHRQMLTSLGSEYEVPVYYGGPAEKKRFADALVHEGIPAPVTSFALFGSPECSRTFGANRNALLLHHAGEVVLSIDDDTICRLARSPGAEQGLSLSTAPDPTQFWVFGDRASVREAAEPVQVGVLEVHERLLGRRLSTCLSRLEPDQPVLLDQAREEMLCALSEGNGRVVTTSLGLAGDSAMAGTRGYLTLREESYERLVQSESDYPRLILSREVFRTVTVPTVSDGTFLMSPSLGIDGRQLVPPFFPVLQNEEGIFSLVARVCNPRGFFGFLPFMVAHEPPQTRVATIEDNLLAGKTFLTEGIVRVSVRSFEPSSRHLDPRRRMQGLGRYLMWLGSLDPTEFEEFIRLELARSMGIAVAYLERSLYLVNEEPAYWAEDVHRYIDSVVEGATSPDLALPMDLKEGRSKEEAVALVQRFIGRYGELLVHWPDILQVSRDLRRQGKTLGGACS